MIKDVVRKKISLKVNSKFVPGLKRRWWWHIDNKHMEKSKIRNESAQEQPQPQHQKQTTKTVVGLEPNKCWKPVESTTTKNVVPKN